MSSKVKHIRNGHKSVLYRDFSTNSRKSRQTRIPHTSWTDRVASALEKKVSTLTELNENILEDLPDEEIETEIKDTDEYV